FMGYNVDRESGEFAVADMKKAIRIIATTPGVKKVHIIAHSRGSDVLASVLQQLAIETYVGRSTLVQRYKIDNVVLFAADIDLDVARTKLFGLGSDPDLPIGGKADPGGVLRHGSFHLTVYSSSKDRALGISGRIFGSSARLGQITLPKISPAKPFDDVDEAKLSQWLDFIEFDGQAGWIGHSYFISDPAVRADLSALIREGLLPGDPGRPLVEIRRPFWRLVERPAPAAAGAAPPP
ncbi:MAG: alpha/beta hydrolase, partial [Rhizobiales bacterium]|nr:alpha/beta hydrolase [Hyphomicrobiales bacterium]